VSESNLIAEALCSEQLLLLRRAPWRRLGELLLSPMRLGLNKPTRWYVEPLAVDNRRFITTTIRPADPR
jgi:hypothetical protein